MCSCPICLTDLFTANSPTAFTTPCGHIFCGTCLDISLKRRGACPYCNSPCDETGIVKLYNNPFFSRAKESQHFEQLEDGQVVSFSILMLVGFLRSKSTKAHAVAVNIIDNLLVCNNADCAKLMTTGAVSLLIDLLNSDSVEVQNCTVSILSKLAANNDDRAQQIMKCGADYQLVRFIEIEEEKVQILALDTLLIFAKFDVQQILKAGAPSQLVRLLYNEELDVCLCRSALRVLNKIAKHLRNFTQLIDADILPLLVHLMNRENEKVQKYAVDILYQLICPFNDVVYIAFKAGAVPPIVNLLGSKSTTVQTKIKAAATLYFFAMHAEYKTIIYAGAIPVLVDALEGDTAVQRLAANILGAVSRHNDCSQHIVDLGALAPLVRLLEKNDSKVQKAATLVLKNLSTYLTKCSCVGAIAPLITLLSNSIEKKVQQCAIEAILSFIKESAHHAQISFSGDVEMLVGLMNSVNKTLRTLAACTLACLWAVQSIDCSAIVNTKTIASLVNLLRRENTEIEHIAAMLLVAKKSVHRDTIVYAGTIVPLVNLLRGENTALKHISGLALLCLAEDSVHRAPMVFAGAITPLKKLYYSSSNTTLKELAASILRKLLL